VLSESSRGFESPILRHWRDWTRPPGIPTLHDENRHPQCARRADGSEFTDTGTVKPRPAALLSSVALLAACGTASTPSGPEAPSPGSSSTGTPAGPAFPLTIARSGGVAGFRDTVVVQADGTTTVTSRTGGPIACVIGPTDLVALSAQVMALVTAPTPTAPGATPDHVVADAISTTMTAGSRNPYTSVEPPDTTPPAVGRLLADVTGPGPAHQICRTT